ncbi:viral A-type inclusion protein [Reticulomyxa filosa]|uniref:Viral A-type inclusion protein n=1 Tax=Reticulomyxa filosa TaxID=46433 RepID=X6MJ27_RETFI|nr:viral A-type inclusion protein [Reticulomyxa filosa]|eukprot:ETO13676.1 viral A-type inclusion protein [Reticulomyxa filosa]
MINKTKKKKKKVLHFYLSFFVCLFVCFWYCDLVNTRQCAQMEARLKLKEDENEELKTELQEMTDKYDALLLRHKETEKERKAQERSFDKERNLLKTQLAETQEKMSYCSTELKTVKAENANMQEQIARNIKKYNELVNTLAASKNQLHQKIAELSHQNDDLESTLVMVRNSWNQTGNVMENQVNVCNSKIERLTKELSDYKQKYESMQPEFEMQEQMIENLQQQRIHMDTEMSNLELKGASQSVEITRLKTHFTQAQSRLDKMRGWILNLLKQGVIEIDSQNDAGNDIVNDILQNGSMETLMTQFSEIDKQNRVLESFSAAEEDNKDRADRNSEPLELNKSVHNSINRDASVHQQPATFQMGHKSRQSVGIDGITASGLTTPVSLDEFDKEHAFESSVDNAEHNAMSDGRTMEMLD